EYIFFYKDDVVETQKRISLNLKDAKVSTVLDKAFSNTNLTYRVIGKQIIVKTVLEQSFMDFNESTNIDLLQVSVVGTVTDSSGQPLPGVNVLVEGTTQGTQSDFDGNYIIRAPEGATLVFSYIGMLSQRIDINGRS